jgi:hypothetical protein
MEMEYVTLHLKCAALVVIEVKNHSMKLALPETDTATSWV